MPRSGGQPVARDPKLRRISGLADTSLSSNMMRVDTRVSQAGVVELDQFLDDDHMVQVKVTQSGGGDGMLWVRYADVNNGYRIKIDGSCNLYLDKYEDGQRTNLVSTTHSECYGVNTYIEFKVKLSGSSIKVWADGSLLINTTDSTHPAGGIAFDGDAVKFDDLKVGYDNNADDDIDDAGDDLVGDEDFGGTSCTVAHDHAGNLVDDCNFRYTYDAWNRLVKVQGSKDGGATTIQTAEFFADGRRANKVVTKSGTYDGTFRYLYDGQKIVEIRNGSGQMVQQFLHGTQYIDELIMVRVKDKGDLYVHQDANWNVIGTTDLGRHVVEHNFLSPYGELTVNQETGFGDRDGDGDVDSTDKGTVGTTCTGTVSGACRILDLDFDGDYDSTDATKFDALPQGYMVRPGLAATATSQPFAHQALLFEPEIASYQNRAREYDPAKRRFVARDPLSITLPQPYTSFSSYLYVEASPTNQLDPTGLHVYTVGYACAILCPLGGGWYCSGQCHCDFPGEGFSIFTKVLVFTAAEGCCWPVCMETCWCNPATQPLRMWVCVQTNLRVATNNPRVSCNCN